MPRPNRYHPYARPSSHTPSITSPPVPSNALPSPPMSSPPVPSPPRSCPQPMPPTGEGLKPQTAPYTPVYPGYIRGITSDGQDLVAKCIVLCPDGTYHLQMEIVRYPSEIISSYMYPPVDQMFDPMLPTWPEFNTEQPNQDPLSQVDFQPNFQEYATMRKDICRSRHSERSTSLDCAILSSEDEDADAEGYGRLEQAQPVIAAPSGKKKVMIDMIIKRAAMQG